jgi:hypothetical protein
LLLLLLLLLLCFEVEEGMIWEWEFFTAKFEFVVEAS